MARPPEVYVRPVTMTLGRRLGLRLVAHWPWATQITVAVNRLQVLEPG
jgi:hypothetical protein